MKAAWNQHGEGQERKYGSHKGYYLYDPDTLSSLHDTFELSLKNRHTHEMWTLA